MVKKPKRRYTKKEAQDINIGRRYTETEAQNINLETMRLNFGDGDANNINLETKTNYMIAIEIAIFSLVFYILISSSFMFISKTGLIIAVVLTMFITLDSVFISKNLMPTGFRKMPHCQKEQLVDAHLTMFECINLINSSITGEKAKNLTYLLISLFLKMILVLILTILLK